MNIIKNKFVVILLVIAAALSVCLVPTFAFAGTDQHTGSGGGGGGGQPWYSSDIKDLCSGITWWTYSGGNDVGLPESPLVHTLIAIEVQCGIFAAIV